MMGAPASPAPAAASTSAIGTQGRMPADSTVRATILPVTRWLLPLALPVLGLILLLAAPEADVHWEHHPAHFWLVLGAALVSVVLGYLAGEAARRLNDARLFLVSLAFITSAGFLGLHALATPGVLLEKPNAGFVVATPVGLAIAGIFAAASAARALAGGIRRHHAAPVAPPRARVRVARGLGGLFARGVAAARPRAHAGGGRRPALPPGRSRVAALRVRSRALRLALPETTLGDAACGRRGLHPAGRGDDRDRPRPELACVVVGVARSDGARVRDRRRRRSGRIPATPIRRRGLRGPLPRAHCGARRPALRAGAEQGPSTPERSTSSSARRSPDSSNRRPGSCAGSTSCSARTCLPSSWPGSASNPRPPSSAGSSAT